MGCNGLELQARMGCSVLHVPGYLCLVANCFFCSFCRSFVPLFNLRHARDLKPTTSRKKSLCKILIYYCARVFWYRFRVLKVCGGGGGLGVGGGGGTGIG